jgi:hypothetical protein
MATGCTALKKHSSRPVLSATRPTACRISNSKDCARWDSASLSTNRPPGNFVGYGT